MIVTRTLIFAVFLPILGVCASGENTASVPSTRPSTATSLTSRSSVYSTWTPEAIAALRKDVAEGNERCVKAESAHLAPTLMDRSVKWVVNVTVVYRGKVLSEDTITTAEGRWTLVEVGDVRKFRFIISETADKKLPFLGFLGDYVYDDDGGFHLLPGISRTFAAGEVTLHEVVGGGCEPGLPDEPRVELNVRRTISPAVVERTVR